MIEILKSFEQAATRFRPIVLVLPGLLMAGLGLFVWLGGLGFRRLLMAVVGALTGALGILCVIRQNPAVMVLAGLLGAFVAVILQRFFTAALLAVMAGCFVFVFQAWPSLAAQPGTPVTGSGVGGEAQDLDLRESMEIARVYLLDMRDAVGRVAGGRAASEWAITVAAAFVLLVIGLLFRHLGGALSCSAVGAGLIFAGFTLLLIFKGSAPVARVQGSGRFYGSVFLGMIAFGTVEQWALCRRADRRERDKAGARTTRPRRKTGKRSWRGR